MFLVFVSAVVPATVIASCLYYLIFDMLALQMMIPEAIAYNLLPVLNKVNLILAVAIPVIIVLIWFAALELSHRIAGPLYRIEKELDEIASGAKRTPIKVRKNDELQSLATRLNKVIFK